MQKTGSQKEHLKSTMLLIDLLTILHIFLLTLWPAYGREMLSAVSDCHICVYRIDYRVSLIVTLAAA
jgi:hypothetical protein